jgi:hypothetical protein
MGYFTNKREYGESININHQYQPSMGYLSININHQYGIFNQMGI